MERIEKLDIYRGLLILLVVIAHTHSPFNILIYSFHMPAWFIVSGYLHSGQPWRKYVAGKISSLLIPFFIANILSLLLLAVLQVKGLSNEYLLKMPIDSFTQRFFQLFAALKTTNELMGATWFLAVLFEVTLLGKIMIGLHERSRLHDAYLLVVSVLIMLFGQSMAAKPQYAAYVASCQDLVLVCQFFYIAGYWLRQAKFTMNAKKWTALGMASLLVLLFQQYVYGQFFDLISRRYNNLYLFCLFTAAGSIVTYCGAQLVSGCLPVIRRLFALLGRRSLYILLFHFTAFKIFSVILVVSGYSLTFVKGFPTPQQNEYAGWYNYVLAGIVFSLIFAELWRWGTALVLRLVSGRNDFVVKDWVYGCLFKD